MLRTEKATVLKVLVSVRMDDARELLRSGIPLRRNGAVYLGGYALECALKARLCDERGDKFLNPRFLTHDVIALAQATAKWPLIERDDARLRNLTSIAIEWNVARRYEVRILDKQQVEAFLELVKVFSQWLLKR